MGCFQSVPNKSVDGNLPLVQSNDVFDVLEERLDNLVFEVINDPDKVDFKTVHAQFVFNTKNKTSLDTIVSFNTQECTRTKKNRSKLMKSVLSLEDQAGSSNTKEYAFEFSELVVFDGKRYTFCDKHEEIFVQKEFKKKSPFVETGVKTIKKPEWSIRCSSDILIVGSHLNASYNTTNVQVLTYKNNNFKELGRVDLAPMVDIILEAHGYSQGYWTIEAVTYDRKNKMLVFWPRQLSKEPFSMAILNKRGTNVFFTVPFDGSSEDPVESLIALNQVSKNDVGIHTYSDKLDLTRGVSASRFLPDKDGNQTRFVSLLKTIEVGDVHETYMTIVDYENRETLVSDTFIGPFKFEGLEVLPLSERMDK